MAKGFMGKKINLFLLIMIFVVLLGFGAISVYYQYTFKNINTRFEELSTSLGACEQNLSQTRSALNTAVQNLNSTETDIRKYDVLYEQKAEQLEEKKGELSDLQAELTRVTVQKQVYKKQIDQAYEQIIRLNNTIDDLERDINILGNQVDSQKDEISCLLNTDDSNEEDCI